MNASKIRIHADLIAANIQHIAGIAGELRRSYDSLYDELQKADPQQDRPFEYFMLHLTRTLHALQSDHITSLAVSVAAMRDYPSSDPAVAPSRPLESRDVRRSVSHGAVPTSQRVGTPSRSATLEGERPASRPVAARAASSTANPIIDVTGKKFYAPELAKSA